VDSRLGDMNAHLIDQSRRIDESNKRIDRLYEVVVRKDEHTNLERKVDDLSNRVDRIERELAASA
jgi:deoxyhypusine synthase